MLFEDQQAARMALLSYALDPNLNAELNDIMKCQVSTIANKIQPENLFKLDQYLHFQKRPNKGIDVKKAREQIALLLKQNPAFRSTIPQKVCWLIANFFRENPIKEVDEQNEVPSIEYAE